MSSSIRTGRAHLHRTYRILLARSRPKQFALKAIYSKRGDNGRDHQETSNKYEDFPKLFSLHDLHCLLLLHDRLVDHLGRPLIPTQSHSFSTNCSRSAIATMISTLLTIFAAASAALAAVTPGVTLDERSIARRSLQGEATFYGGNVKGGMCSFSTYTLPAGLHGTALSSSNWRTGGNCRSLRHDTQRSNIVLNSLQAAAA